MATRSSGGVRLSDSSDYDQAVLDDLRFYREWEQGRSPWLGAVARIRQIRRANPALAGGMSDGGGNGMAGIL